MTKQYIFIDPDGTSKQWLYLIVQAETKIIYSTQCAGLDNEIKSTEGFLYPLNGLAFDHTHDLIHELNSLNEIFHLHQKCLAQEKLKPKQIQELAQIIENITIWHTSDCDIDDQRDHLRLDESRLDEITEAWIPVISPYGQAILIWKNCD